MIPLVFLAVLAVIQFALWSHATHVAQAATAQALAVARAQDGTTKSGHAAGQQLLDDLAHGPLQNAQLTVSRGDTAVSVTVQGDIPAVVPDLHLHIHAEATGAVERFIPDVPGAH